MGKEILDELERLIRERKKSPRKDSYTATLFEKGKIEILKKIGEEATEVILSSCLEGKDRIIHETADLIYHLMVLLALEDIELNEIMEELERRFGKSGFQLKAQQGST